MATDEFERYVESWAPRSVNGHPALPRTLISGVPKERRAEAQLEVELGMPIDEIKGRLERIDLKLEQLIIANAAQVILNGQAERNRMSIEDGKDGILVRLKSLEDSRRWSDYFLKTFIGVLVGSFVTALLAWWRK